MYLATSPRNRLAVTDGGRLDSGYAYLGFYGAPQGYFADNNSPWSAAGSQWNTPARAATT